MKKLISVVLAMAMILSLATFTFAYEAPAGIDSLAIVGSVPGLAMWDPADDNGDMELVADYVYEKEVTLTAGSSMTFKVAGNDKWDDTCNFGTDGKKTLALGTVTDMICGGGSDDMTVNATKDMTVKITVDLSNFVNGGAATILVEEVVEPEIQTVDIVLGGFNMIQLPGESYVNIVVDATAGDVALSIQGSANTYLDIGMRIIYPNPIGVIEHNLMGGSVYTLKLGTFSADGEYAMVNASSMAPGSQFNPAELSMGKNVVTAPEMDAYYIDWTAPEAGTLTIAMDAAEYNDWTCSV